MDCSFREGNLPPNSKCARCRKACWSPDCLTGGYEYVCTTCLPGRHKYSTLCRAHELYCLTAGHVYTVHCTELTVLPHRWARVHCSCTVLPHRWACVQSTCIVLPHRWARVQSSCTVLLHIWARVQLSCFQVLSHRCACIQRSCSHVRSHRWTCVQGSCSHVLTGGHVHSLRGRKI